MPPFDKGGNRPSIPFKKAGKQKPPFSQQEIATDALPQSPTREKNLL